MADMYRSLRNVQNLLLAALICFSLLFLRHFVFENPQAGIFAVSSTRYYRSLTRSKHAYCALLAEPNDSIKTAGEDNYYVGIRMLIYQLLHDPITKTTSNPPIPFVVLVTGEVAEWKRQQLSQDGAIIQEIQHMDFDWIKPDRVRWAHVMDKLAVFQLTDYEKVLLLDSDIVVVAPLDGVFEDPATHLAHNLGLDSNTKQDENVQPIHFMIAGNSQDAIDRLNAGFVILRPSIEMYEHYLSVAGISGRFRGGSPEQDLWNYVHRRDGNMPWKQLDARWTVNHPSYADYERGVAALHEKYWKCNHDPKLRDVLLRSRWKMEGFFSIDRG